MAGQWLRGQGAGRGTRVRLVCFPHAGGAAAFFYPWGSILPPDVELVVVQYPGRHDRLDEPPVADLDELLSGLVPELDGLDDRPTVFLGHSMGATIAYEAVRKVSRTPELLVVSARPAPHIDCRSGQLLAGDAEMVARVERLGGLDAGALSNPELLALVMPALRADYRLVETYEPRTAERLDVGILAVVGDRDPEVRVADVAAWREVTVGSFSLHVLPGDHFFVGTHASTVAGLALGLLARDAAPAVVGAPVSTPRPNSSRSSNP